MQVFTTDAGATICASGEVGARPAVHVWDVDSRTTLATLQGFHRQGVAQLDFSPDREKLVTLGEWPSDGAIIIPFFVSLAPVFINSNRRYFHHMCNYAGMDPYHSLAVYRWRTRERLWSSRTTVDPVHDVRFLANDIIGK